MRNAQEKNLSCLLLKLESSPMNLKSLAMRMKSWREDLINSAMMPLRSLLSMRIRLPYCLNNSRDSMASSNERTTKSELWEEKYKTPNKTSDSQLLKLQNLAKNSSTTKTDSKPLTKNQKHTDKKFKSCFLKTQIWEMKSEMLKKTSDFQPLKSERLPTNLRSPATKTSNFKEDSTRWVTFPKDLLSQKESCQFFLKKLKDWMVSLRRRTSS